MDSVLFSVQRQPREYAQESHLLNLFSVLQRLYLMAIFMVALPTKSYVCLPAIYSQLYNFYLLIQYYVCLQNTFESFFLTLNR